MNNKFKNKKAQFSVEVQEEKNQ